MAVAAGSRHEASITDPSLAQASARRRWLAGDPCGLLKAEAAVTNAGRLGVCAVPKMQKMQKVQKVQPWAVNRQETQRAP